MKLGALRALKVLTYAMTSNWPAELHMIAYAMNEMRGMQQTEKEPPKSDLPDDGRSETATAAVEQHGRSRCQTTAPKSGRSETATAAVEQHGRGIQRMRRTTAPKSGRSETATAAIVQVAGSEEDETESELWRLQRHKRPRDPEADLDGVTAITARATARRSRRPRDPEADLDGVTVITATATAAMVQVAGSETATAAVEVEQHGQSISETATAAMVQVAGSETATAAAEQHGRGVQTTAPCQTTATATATGSRWQFPLWSSSSSGPPLDLDLDSQPQQPGQSLPLLATEAKQVPKQQPGQSLPLLATEAKQVPEPDSNPWGWFEKAEARARDFYSDEARARDFYSDAEAQARDLEFAGLKPWIFDPPGSRQWLVATRLPLIGPSPLPDDCGCHRMPVRIPAKNKRTSFNTADVQALAQTEAEAEARPHRGNYRPGDYAARRLGNVRLLFSLQPVKRGKGKSKGGKSKGF